ncbi:MAG: hypothetical protein WBG46_10360 [Nonlabens sp.]
MFISIAIIAVAVLIAMTRAVAKRNKVYSQFYWVAIPSLVLSIYSLCTCWIWLYYAALYISLPVFAVAVILGIIAGFRKKDQKFYHLLIGVQIITVLVSSLSAWWFL